MPGWPSAVSARGAARRPTATTRAPSAANARAVARPIPVPAPVTRTIRGSWEWLFSLMPGSSDPDASDKVKHSQRHALTNAPRLSGNCLIDSHVVCADGKLPW